MAQNKIEEREFIINLLNDIVKPSLLHLSNLIIIKLCMALKGDDFLKVGDENASDSLTQVDTGFMQALLDSGLSQEDYEKLQAAGIDINELSKISYEKY